MSRCGIDPKGILEYRENDNEEDEILTIYE
jgi:hypothetical protein